MTMYDQRTNLAKDVINEVQEHFPGLVFEINYPSKYPFSRSSILWTANICL